MSKSGRKLLVDIAALIGWLAVCFAAATLGAVASVNAPEFYRQLSRPDRAPPAWLFGPVWTLLYLLMGVAAWLVWREARIPWCPHGARALSVPISRERFVELVIFRLALGGDRVLGDRRLVDAHLGNDRRLLARATLGRRTARAVPGLGYFRHRAGLQNLAAEPAALVLTH